MYRAWWQIIRPRQWVKNLFVLAPLLFARKLFEQLLLVEALAATAIFCLLSSSVYMFNDVVDAESDRHHPQKRHRPVAAGVLPPRRVLPAAAALAALGLLAAWLLRPAFALAALAYLLLNLLYTLVLKRYAFVDVAVIAGGFVLRVVAGAEAIDVAISRWLVVCTFCLACLLGLGKRRHELSSGGGAGNNGRRSLAGYRMQPLHRLEKILAAVTIVAYLSYSLDPLTVAKFGTRALVFTSLFPLLGMLRYLQLVERNPQTAPTDALVTDWPTLVNLACWVAAVIFILYHR